MTLTCLTSLRRFVASSFGCYVASPMFFSPRGTSAM